MEPYYSPGHPNVFMTTLPYHSFPVIPSSDYYPLPQTLYQPSVINGLNYSYPFLNNGFNSSLFPLVMNFNPENSAGVEMCEMSSGAVLPPSVTNFTHSLTSRNGWTELEKGMGDRITNQSTLNSRQELWKKFATNAIPLAVDHKACDYVHSNKDGVFGSVANQTHQADLNDQFITPFLAIKPPSWYICHNCNQPGHYIKHCPKAREQQLTSYLGKKKCVGIFICSKCNRRWNSTNSYSQKGQLCNKCGILVFPHKQYSFEKAIEVGVLQLPCVGCSRKCTLGMSMIQRIVA